jgi:tRNA splicing endonuclease
MMQFQLFFDLSPSGFENLCFDLLYAEGGNFWFNNDSNQRWFDIAGERFSPDGTTIKVAVEVKHRRVFYPEGLRFFVDQLSKSDLQFDEYMFITSSPLTTSQLKKLHSDIVSPTGLKISLLGQMEVIQLLEKHQDIASKHLKAVERAARKRGTWLAVSLIGIFTSVLSLKYATAPFTNDQERDSFKNKIHAVETNLNNLKGLEDSLIELKKELQKTSYESAKIKKEYEEALKLKEVTAEQLAHIKIAVSAQSSSDTLLNYFLGFILGVASSILATIITDRWKAKRALSGP